MAKAAATMKRGLGRQPRAGVGPCVDVSCGLMDSVSSRGRSRGGARPVAHAAETSFPQSHEKVDCPRAAPGPRTRRRRAPERRVPPAVGSRASPQRRGVRLLRFMLRRLRTAERLGGLAGALGRGRVGLAVCGGVICAPVAVIPPTVVRLSTLSSIDFSSDDPESGTSAGARRRRLAPRTERLPRSFRISAREGDLATGSLHGVRLRTRPGQPSPHPATWMPERR